MCILTSSGLPVPGGYLQTSRSNASEEKTLPAWLIKK